MRNFASVKKYISAILALSLLYLLSFGAFAAENKELAYERNVKAAVIYNIENNTIVYGKNEDAVLPTASFAKMMTAICAYELLSDRLDDTITVEYNMIQDVTGNQVGYYVGETVSVRDMFGGLLTRGANDSAYLLCYAAKGSVGAFVEYMNEKAAVLGMTSTVYKNPTGVHADGMVTTARDSIAVSKRFYEIDFLTELSNSVTYEMPETNKSVARSIYNRNGLVARVVDAGYFDPRVTGFNAGSTVEAGYYAASAVKSEELSYIITVLGGELVDELNTAYLFTSELAKHALENFGYVDVMKPSDIICEIPVRLSTDADYVTLVPCGTLTLYLPTALDIKNELEYTYELSSESLDAPVTEGEVAGKYTVTKDGVWLGSVDLVTKNSVARSEFLAALDAIEKFTTSPIFIAAMILIVLLIILHFVMQGIMRTRRRRRNYQRR
ncbi:MAG: D-alanyl-D-alanine carboxypeptidase [Clostridia bacterium]|nr:D-alanyl-D-alanine carboxypeptidase [Clostridia bacterium]